MKKSFLIFFLAIIAGTLFSQEKVPDAWKHARPNNVFSLSTGLNQVKEENIFNVPNNGTFVMATYGRERTANHLSTFRLSLSYSRMRTGLEDVSKSVNLGMIARYEFTFHLVDQRRLDYFIGPGGRLDYSVNYIPNWDDSHFYWANFLSLDVMNHLIYTFNNNNVLWIKASFPILSVVSRPDKTRLYKIDDLDFGGLMKSFHNNLEPGSWNVLFYFDGSLEYRYRISNRVSQSIGYNIDYVFARTNNSNTYRQLIHMLSLNLYF